LCHLYNDGEPVGKYFFAGITVFARGLRLIQMKRYVSPESGGGQFT